MGSPVTLQGNIQRGLVIVAAACAVLASALFLPPAHALSIQVQQKGVQGGKYVEHYEGICTNRNYGKPWRVYFDNESGWTYQGPNGTHRAYGGGDWMHLAHKACGYLDGSASE